MALIEAPEFFRGRDTEGLRSVYDYLVRLSDQLNIALNSMSVTQFIPEEAAKLQLVTGTGETASQETLQQQIAQQAETLKAFIIKTASTVKYEMDEVFHEMVGTYDAESEDEQYKYSARWHRMTVDTALGTTTTFKDAVEMTVEEGVAAFHKYQAETQQVITIGRIGDDAGGAARYGISIASILSAVEAEGDYGVNTYTKGRTRVELVSDRLSFYDEQNAEVAYLSNSKLYIRSAEIVNQLSMGHLLATVNSADGSVSIGYNSGWQS